MPIFRNSTGHPTEAEIAFEREEMERMQRQREEGEERDEMERIRSVQIEEAKWWLTYKEGELEAANSKAKELSSVKQAVNRCRNELNHFKTLICDSCEKREAEKQGVCPRCWAWERFVESDVFLEYRKPVKMKLHRNAVLHIKALLWIKALASRETPKDRGLFIHGPTGGGKTRTATAVWRCLIRHFCQTQGCLGMESFQWMKAEELQAMNQENKSTPRWIEESGILDCRLLLIDDIDHRITPTFPNVVYRIMDARINDTKGVTILTSNQSLSELKNHFGKEGPPIVRRIHENFKVLHFSNGAKLPE